jgi:hypothetical protein
MIFNEFQNKAVYEIFEKAEMAGISQTQLIFFFLIFYCNKPVYCAQARISLRAKARGPARGGTGFEELYNFFLLLLNFSPAAPAAPFHENFAIGLFSPNISSAAPFNVYFCSYACPGGP